MKLIIMLNKPSNIVNQLLQRVTINTMLQHVKLLFDKFIGLKPLTLGQYTVSDEHRNLYTLIRDLPNIISSSSRMSLTYSVRLFSLLVKCPLPLQVECFLKTNFCCQGMIGNAICTLKMARNRNSHFGQIINITGIIVTFL